MDRCSNRPRRVGRGTFPERWALGAIPERRQHKDLEDILRDLLSKLGSRPALEAARRELDAARQELASLREANERSRIAANQRQLALQRELAFLREYARNLEQGALGDDKHIFRAARLDAGWTGLAPDPGVELIRKNSRERLIDSGLTREQSFFLEVNCLIRLNRAERGRTRKHFPTLVDIDADDMSFTITRTGRSLDRLREQDGIIAVRDLRSQAAAITSALERAGVIHLDLDQSGKNLTVDEAGVISVIDFDYAVLDRIPYSARMGALLKRFDEMNGYVGFGWRILKAVENCPRIRVTLLLLYCALVGLLEPGCSGACVGRSHPADA